MITTIYKSASNIFSIKETDLYKTYLFKIEDAAQFMAFNMWYYFAIDSDGSMSIAKNIYGCVIRVCSYVNISSVDYVCETWFSRPARNNVRKRCRNHNRVRPRGNKSSRDVTSQTFFRRNKILKIRYI